MVMTDGPPFGLDDPRTHLWDNGRRVTSWWIEARPDGSTFYRRWVRTSSGWDYDDREPWDL
jgi:hypothetical protein